MLNKIQNAMDENEEADAVAELRTEVHLIRNLMQPLLELIEGCENEPDLESSADLTADAREAFERILASLDKISPADSRKG